MNIEIDGLNYHQRILADILWNLDTQEELDAFFDTLDSDELMEAKTILQMMILATMDDVRDTRTAKDILRKFRL